MAFQNLTKHPQKSAVGITILGLLFADGLNAIDTSVLGRFFIYLGEVLTTISVLMAAQEASENTQDNPEEAIKENKITTVGKADTTKTDDVNAGINLTE